MGTSCMNAGNPLQLFLQLLKELEHNYCESSARSDESLGNGLRPGYLILSRSAVTYCYLCEIVSLGNYCVLN